MNGLVDCDYFTIHVTPEAHCSYASFETSVPMNQILQVDDCEVLDFNKEIKTVLNIFKPTAFNVVLFSNGQMENDNCNSTLAKVNQQVQSYSIKDNVLKSLGGWQLQYMQFESYDQQ